MDMDAIRLQDSWLVQMSGVITLMAIFLPVEAWALKHSHVGMSGTVLEEVALTVMSKDSSAAHIRLEVPTKKQGWCQVPPTPKNLIQVQGGEPQEQPPEGFNRQNRAVAVPVSQVCETQG